MTVEEAVAALERKAIALPQEVRRAEVEIGQRVLTSAREHSQGPYSLKTLAKMGRPYARRHGVSQLDPAVINVQSGRFAGSWSWLLPTAIPGGLQTVIYNASPEAEWMAGTLYMVPRPLDEKVLGENEEAILKTLDGALERALRR